jgi:hypothetical protein
MPRNSNKPPWILTNTPPKLKKRMWYRMAFGESDQQVGVWLELQRGKDKQSLHLSRHTIETVRLELSLLPEDLAKKLPKVVYTYWLSLRKGLVDPTITVEGTYDVLPEPPKAKQPLMLGTGETKANENNNVTKQSLSLKQGSTSEKIKQLPEGIKNQQSAVAPKPGGQYIDEKLLEGKKSFSPHDQELFYFGQRLRDCFSIPSPYEFFSNRIGEEDLPIWGKSKKLILSNSEEKSAEKKWGSQLYDARKHSLFFSFRQHLSGNDCWTFLKQIETDYSEYREHCVYLRSEIRKSLNPLEKRMTNDGLEIMTNRLLMSAWAQGYALNPVLEEEMEEDYTVSPDGSMHYPMLEEELKTKYESIVNLELGQAEQRMLELIRGWIITPIVFFKRDDLFKTIKQFQKSLCPDEYLRAWILSGTCELCR